MRYPFLFIALLLFSCNNSDSKNYTVAKLLSQINKDSLLFNTAENTYYDRFGDNSGSLYKFNMSGNLVFYCFVNEKSYPYAEYYNNKGGLSKKEGNPSIQYRFSSNDTLYRFSFLFSTFRKSKYKIVSVTNFKDTLLNNLTPAKGYSNVGYFNLILRSYEDAISTTVINSITYFDSLTSQSQTYTDTVYLKNILSGSNKTYE